MLKYLYFACIISCCLCQYQDQNYNAESRQYDNYENARSPKYPQILSHKQSLNHDGNFNYAFASENGLLQGETISPDGSRTGAYTYVDPHGKKITVKYKAGKEGFKILQGDHIPKVHPLIAAAAQPPHPGYATSRNDEDEGYIAAQPPRPAFVPPPNIERRPRPANFYIPFRTPNPNDEGIIGKPISLSRPPLPPGPRNNEVLPYPLVQPQRNGEEREPEYNDEPGKPNSFGEGYAFEFAG